MSFIPERWRRNLILVSMLTGISAMGMGLTRTNAADLSYWAGGDMVFGDFAIPKCYYKIGLPEEQARRIIRDEAEKAGLFFNFEDINIEPPDWAGCGNPIPHYSQSLFPNPNIVFTPNKLEPGDQTDVFHPDLSLRLSHNFDEIDTEHQIVCEYISANDTGVWHYETPEKAAQVLAEELRNEPTLFRYGIFSDCDEETLRFQVRSFIAWLRINGSL